MRERNGEKRGRLDQLPVRNSNSHGDLKHERRKVEGRGSQ